MKTAGIKGLVTAMAIIAWAIAPLTATAGSLDRFKEVQVWDATFEYRYGLDQNGKPYKHFEGTRSIKGSIRWEKPFEDYGISWSGIGKATVTTTEGTEEIEIDETHLSILFDKKTYAAFSAMRR